MTKLTKADFQNQYKQIGKVFSPFFQEEILFELSGWNHLVKDGSGNPRSEEEFLARFEILKIGFLFLNKKFPPTEYSCRDYGNNYLVEFYSFIYAYKNKLGQEFRVKIVIRQKSDTTKHFYSIIKMNHKHFENKKPYKRVNLINGVR